MNVVRDLHTFERLLARVGETVDVNVAAPDRVFTSNTWKCVFCSFDLCFSPDLLRSCAEACRAVEDDSFSFVMLEPDPIGYYYKEFGRTGAVTIRSNDDFEESWSYFEEEPGRIAADALMYAVQKFVVVSSGKRWAVWGSRDDDIIIVGADNTETLQAFSMERCRVCDVNDALSTFLLGDHALAERMRANYCSDRRVGRGFRRDSG